MQTTPRGIKYPEASDNPKRTDLQELAETADTAIGNLASDVASLHEDTGWIDALLQNGFEEYNNSYTPRYRRLGKLVVVQGAVKPTGSTAQTQLNSGGDAGSPMFTLPVGFRPSHRVANVQQGSSYAIWHLIVHTNGAVVGSRYRTGATAGGAIAGSWLPFHVTYLID